MRPQQLLASVVSVSCKSCFVKPFSTTSITNAKRYSSPRKYDHVARQHDSELTSVAEVDDRFYFSNELSEYIKFQDLSPGRSPSSLKSIKEAAAQHGMPWSATIGRTEEKDPVLYMPFWEWQLEFMQTSLTNLHPIECTRANDIDLSYNENREKRARIVSHCYASDEYRKIRMTYYDAGDSVQVFNSVWYPDVKYNLPVLGIDLLSFNRKKYLAIVDFQPLHLQEEWHSTQYEHVLKPIRDKYESLKGKMSSKFYDETQFFSKAMLFARFEDSKIVYDDLFPAFKSYVAAHVELVRSTPKATNLQDIQFVLERQKAYDTYSAERDPAAGLFTAMFGQNWAEYFISNFLFSLCEKHEQLDPSLPNFSDHSLHKRNSTFQYNGNRKKIIDAPP